MDGEAGEKLGNIPCELCRRRLYNLHDQPFKMEGGLFEVPHLLVLSLQHDIP